MEKKENKADISQQKTLLVSSLSPEETARLQALSEEYMKEYEYDGALGLAVAVFLFFVASIFAIAIVAIVLILLIS